MDEMHSNTFPLRSRLDGTIFPPGKRSKPSEGELAERLAAADHRELGYLSAARGRKAGWIIWSDGEWQPDRLNTALRLAPQVCAEASVDCGDPSLDAYRTAAAVLALTECDPRIAVRGWPCNPDILDAIEAWLAGLVEADPEGFLSLADLRKTLPQAREWDCGEANAALEECGISFGRSGRKAGFAGVKLREERR
jgi:hypothetical protein